MSIHLYRRVVRAVQDPGYLKSALLKRCPHVISAGPRAMCRSIKHGDVAYFKKVFSNGDDALKAYQREIAARQIFAGEPWLSPIIDYGKDYIKLPLYPESARLDIAVKSMTEQERRLVAREAIRVMFQIFLRGHAHCDFHVYNLFWIEGQLIVTDFEHMRPYPKGRVSSFPESYDLIGQGLESPGATGNMCYNADKLGRSLRSTLGIPLTVALDLFVEDMEADLREASLSFKSRGSCRHVCKAQRIYASFELPYFRVSKEKAQRDSSLRLSNMRLDRDTVQGKTVLDIGCNIGAMLFEIQKFYPSRCIGIEYDEQKVDMAKRIAAYNGLSNVHFVRADIEKLSVDETGGPFDFVFCLSVEAYVKKKRHLYRFLAEATREKLFFEGNPSTNRHEVRRQLLRHGFKDVEFLGMCNDDCREENNNRPMLIARK